MKILLVEDNISFAEELIEKLQRPFGETKWMETESDFVYGFEEIATDPPTVAIIDVMLQWDIPRREGIRPVPPDLTDMTGGIYKAGLRCATRMVGDPRTQYIPIILYTLVDLPDIQAELQKLPKSVIYLQKTSDLGVVDLIRRITGPSRTLAGQD